MYSQAFQHALRFREQLGMTPMPAFAATATNYLNASHAFAAMCGVLRKQNLLNPLHRGGLCDVVSSFVAHDVAKAVGAKASYFTIGAVTRNGDSPFNTPFTADTIRAIVNGHERLTGKKVNPHVWLTLDSMEVVDLTILPYMARGNPAFYVASPATCDIVAGDPDQNPFGWRFHPLLVGDDLYTNPAWHPNHSDYVKRHHAGERNSG